MSMKLLVFGPVRSGTTLACELLSVVNRSVVIPEPGLWSDERPSASVAMALTAAGIETKVITETDNFGWFTKRAEAMNAQFDWWGIKEVTEMNARAVITWYSPHVLLVVRELHESILSAIVLHQSNPSNVTAYIDVSLNAARYALQLFKAGAKFVRYRDMIEPEFRFESWPDLDLNLSGGNLIGKLSVPHSIYHEGGVTKKSLDKWGVGKSKFKRMAEDAALKVPEYYDAFGLERPQ